MDLKDGVKIDNILYEIEGHRSKVKVAMLKNFGASDGLTYADPLCHNIYAVTS